MKIDFSKLKEHIHKADQRVIYFLTHRKRVVYVGMTCSLFARIGNHSADSKKFDSVFYIDNVLTEDVEILEYCLITRLNPKYNTALTKLKYRKLSTQQIDNLINKYIPNE